MSVITAIPFGTRVQAQDLAPETTASFSTTLSSEERAALEQMSTMIAVEAGTALVIENSVGAEVFIVVDGSASVSRDGDSVAVVGVGDIIGEAALLSNKPRNATVTATTPMTLLALTAREFAAVLKRCPQMSSRIRDLVAERGA